MMWTNCSADRGGSVKECVEDPALPEECANFKRMLFECRRGQLVIVCVEKAVVSKYLYFRKHFPTEQICKACHNLQVK